MKTIFAFFFLLVFINPESALSQVNYKRSSANNSVWEWARSFGGFGNDEGNALCHDGEGNIYACGHFKSQIASFGSDTINNAGTVDMYVVKCDPAGTVIWARSAGGVSDDYATDISIDLEGSVYITGYYNSPSINLGADTLIKSNSDSTSDAFIIKYNGSGNVLWAKSIGGQISEWIRSMFR